MQKICTFMTVSSKECKIASVTCSVLILIPLDKKKSTSWAISCAFLISYSPTLRLEAIFGMVL